MAKATEKTEAVEAQGATITELVEIIKERTGKEVEQQNLRATLRNLVKKEKLVHEPRTRWSFSDEDVDVVVAHYDKGGDDDAEQEEKAKAPAKKRTSKKAAKNEEPIEEPEVDEDEDDLELEDI